MGQETAGGGKKKLSRSNVSTAALQPAHIQGNEEADKISRLNYRAESLIFTLGFNFCNCRTAELDKMVSAGGEEKRAEKVRFWCFLQEFLSDQIPFSHWNDGKLHTSAGRDDGFSQ